MEKVKLTRELADSLINARKRCSDEEILYALAQSSLTFPVNDKRGIALLEVVRARGNTSLLQIASALTNGYEVEKTPEEIILEQLRGHIEAVKFYSVRRNLDVCEIEQERFSSGYVSGVEDIAKAYGIKIEGVNA